MCARTYVDASQTPIHTAAKAKLHRRKPGICRLSDICALLKYMPMFMSKTLPTKPSRAQPSQGEAKSRAAPRTKKPSPAADRTEKNAPREEGPPHHHAIEFHYIEQKPTNTARDNVGYDSVRSTTLSEGMMHRAPAVTRVGT